jgi:hypothetical protein
MRVHAEHGLFEVTDHAELKDRGAFVVGRIVDGVIRPGMRVTTRLDPPALTISGVESLDNLSERKHCTALVFAEHPTLEFVARAFPIGGLVDVEAEINRAS